jgi:enhancer of yellow 2 transcription factor
MSALLEQRKAELLASGAVEPLQQQLRVRLAECGWRDEIRDEACACACAGVPRRSRVRLQCRRLVRQRGYENLSVDQLVAELTARGLASVPAALRASTTASIKAALAEAQK